MAPTKGSRTPGAPRARGYHVKTGCITCKIRHVKCDEGKPECQKCLSTGRQCDGYQVRSEATDSNRTRSLVRASVSRSPSLDTIHPSLWNGTTEELRGFDYFRTQTSEDLAYSLNASLEELVLQTSHRFDAIKHGAIALGWLGMLIRVNSGYSRPWLNHRPALCRYEFARTQYYKAMQTLRKDLARNDKDAVNTTLISCFLFIVFEFLQGNDRTAIAHLKSGLNILRKQFFPPDAKPDGPTFDKLVGKLDPMQSEIARIFHILDAQATMWMELRTSQATTRVLKPDDDCTSPPSTTAKTYSSLEEASKDLNDLVIGVQDFQNRTSNIDLTTTLDPSFYSERDALLDALEVHRRRLTTFVGSRAASSDYPEDPQRITILRINRKVITIVLVTCLEPKKAVFYAQSMWQFWQIVSLATLILRPRTDELRQKVPEFVTESESGAPEHPQDPDSTPASSREPNAPSLLQPSSFEGLIQPLYFTAVKCRDRSTAERALKLLEMDPWREGQWESAHMAALARTEMEALRLRGWYEVGEGGLAPGVD
ncbi:MAG: hypothetical protein L6R37_006052 [Teloschistes peruensis]|nr:MAG: hypothetical protein L6R37_006052 [Teloschistes peruensis]